MNFLNVSIAQVLNTWTQLVEARYGVNNYGGDVGEFYIYTLIPASQHGSWRKTDDEAITASNTLHAICKYFENENSCWVTFAPGELSEEGGEPIDELLKNPTGHRVRLKVTYDSKRPYDKKTGFHAS